VRRIGALLACGLALAGCGLGAGKEQSGDPVELVVTRDFGHRELKSVERDKLRPSDTVMRLLRSNFKITTRFGGGFVQSIDGLSSGGVGSQLDWFFFVNGIESSEGAASYKLSPGDHVQWDRRDWSATMRVPAIVGAFPEPFLHGTKGKRPPTRVECDDPNHGACAEVKHKLDLAGVPTSSSTIGSPGGEKVAHLVVAPWREARLVGAAAALEKGPKASGVFARFAHDGSKLTLLDQKGGGARTVRPGDGTGIVAATRGPRDELVWLVTGLDSKAVDAAAHALAERRLRSAFAVAVTGRRVEKLPLLAR
jgi:Domain of unknown function (DUF4430)